MKKSWLVEIQVKNDLPPVSKTGNRTVCFIKIDDAEDEQQARHKAFGVFMLVPNKRQMSEDISRLELNLLKIADRRDSDTDCSVRFSSYFASYAREI